MSYTLVSPLAEMRVSPASSSDIVSEALFGETLLCLDAKEGWLFVETPDLYRGWIPSSTAIEREVPYSALTQTVGMRVHLYREERIEPGPLFSLPYGVSLQVTPSINPRFLQAILPNGKTLFVRKGDVGEKTICPTKEEIALLSTRFLEIPYLWGGRSSFGFDCSGFVQKLYQHLGVHLPRDAKDQILDPQLQIVPFEALCRGDLIFFGASSAQISHVGLFLGEDRFIHATNRQSPPSVCISRLSTWGKDPYRIGMGCVRFSFSL